MPTPYEMGAQHVQWKLTANFSKAMHHKLRCLLLSQVAQAKNIIPIVVMVHGQENEYQKKSILQHTRFRPELTDLQSCIKQLQDILKLMCLLSDIHTYIYI